MSKEVVTDADAADPDFLALKIKALQGSTFSIRVRRGGTVADLKEQIHNEQDIPVPRQRLIYKGKVLHDIKTLAEYDPKDGDALHLIVRKEDAPPDTTAPPQPVSSRPHGHQPHMMMNTINLQQGQPMPDLNSLVSQMLSGIGGSGMAAHAGATRVPVSDVQQAINMAQSLNGADQNQIPIVVDQPSFEEIRRALLVLQERLDDYERLGRNERGNGMDASSSSSNSGFGHDNDADVDIVDDSVTTPVSTRILPSDVPLTDTIEGLVSLLRDTYNSISAVLPFVQSHTEALHNERQVNDNIRRTILQDEAHALGGILRHLGPTLSQIGRRLTSVMLPHTNEQSQEQAVASTQRQVEMFQQMNGPSVQGVTIGGIQNMNMQSIEEMLANGPNLPAPPPATSETIALQTLPSTLPSERRNLPIPLPPANLFGRIPDFTPFAGGYENAHGAANPNPVSLVIQAVEHSGYDDGFMAGGNVGAGGSTAGNATAGPPLASVANMFNNPSNNVHTSVHNMNTNANNTSNMNSNVNNMPGNMNRGSNNLNMTDLMSIFGPMMAGTNQASTPPVIPTTANANTNTNANTIANVNTNVSANASANADANANAANPLANLMATLGPMLGNAMQMAGNGNVAIAGGQGLHSMSSGVANTGSASTVNANTNVNTTANASVNTRATASVPANTTANTNATTNTPANTNASTSANTNTAAVNPMAGIMGMLGPMMAAMNQGGGAAAMGGGAGGIAQMMATMMGGGSIGSSSGTSTQPINTDTDFGAVDDLPDLEDDDEDDENTGVMDLFLKVLMSRLAFPDMLALINGDWSCFEPLRSDFRKSMLKLLGGNDSPAVRASTAIRLTEGLVAIVNDVDVLVEAGVYDKMLENVSPETLSMKSTPVLRRRIAILIDLLMDDDLVASNSSSSSTTSSTPFSDALKQWCIYTVGEWVHVLSTCFSDGVTSVTLLFKTIASKKLSETLAAGDSDMGGMGGMAGMMLPMVSGMMASVILNTYNKWRSAELNAEVDGGGANWLENVPEGERAEWQRVIDMDVIVQKEQKQQEEVQKGQNSSKTSTFSGQRPFSRAYLMNRKAAAGTKSSQNSTGDDDEQDALEEGEAKVTQSLHRGLKRAIETVDDSAQSSISSSSPSSIPVLPPIILALDQASSTSASTTTTNTPNTDADLKQLKNLYKKQLVTDLRDRLTDDADYLHHEGQRKDKFPNISKNVMK